MEAPGKGGSCIPCACTLSVNPKPAMETPLYPTMGPGSAKALKPSPGELVVELEIPFEGEAPLTGGGQLGARSFEGWLEGGTLGEYRESFVGTGGGDCPTPGCSFRWSWPLPLPGGRGTDDICTHGSCSSASELKVATEENPHFAS